MLQALPNLWWAYVPVGLICGVFGATFGVGSGIIMVPILVLIFALPQKSAQGTCLAVMIPMALVSTLRYRLNPEVRMDMRVVAMLALGAVIGALVGSSIAGWASGLVLRKLFAIIMIAVAVRMLIK